MNFQDKLDLCTFCKLSSTHTHEVMIVCQLLMFVFVK